MTPKIIFKYSEYYDLHWKEFYSLQKQNFGKSGHKYMVAYIEKVDKIWRRHEKSILKELSAVTGLKWIDKSIACYVVGKCIPFSDPLTLPIAKSVDYFIDILVHELIHVLLIQGDNEFKWWRFWKSYINKKYKKESPNTQIHIAVHAIHAHIFMKFFGRGRLDREIKALSGLKDYKRAWDIVERDGYQEIIKQFSRRIRS